MIASKERYKKFNEENCNIFFFTEALPGGTNCT